MGSLQLTIRLICFRWSLPIAIALPILEIFTKILCSRSLQETVLRVNFGWTGIILLHDGALKHFFLSIWMIFLGSLVILVVVLILVELSLEIVVINLLNNIMVGLTDSSKRLTALDGSGLCPFERGLVATF